MEEQPIPTFHFYIRGEVINVSFFFCLFSRVMHWARWTRCTVVGCVAGRAVAGRSLLPCHSVVWHSARRRIITIPPRWLTSMIWDRLSNREYTYVVVLTRETGEEDSSVFGVRFAEKCLFFFFSSGRNSVRSSGRRTGTLWECTPVKSSIRRTGGKWGKLLRMRSWF